ncbi:MAG: LuxR C-terminal-related transcriptional regulator [Flavobacteriales bacterium]|jgi:DNA-binding CsgD family transcriptional regulator|nr:LuxR C-terminal-related transcriptional regulator [Flavobacteriales bacterium]
MFRILLFLLWIPVHSFGQFSFEIAANSDYQNATAYLNIVKDLSQKEVFYTENILLETQVDSNGFFVFKGDFLPKTNRIYKIYINNCEESITHPDHLLNQCVDNLSYLFIANNSDQFLYPLNELKQMFCAPENEAGKHIALEQIEHHRINLLSRISEAKNDAQRKLIYQKYYEKIRDYSLDFPWALAKLYGFYLYADEASFAYPYFQNDQKIPVIKQEIMEQLEAENGDAPYLLHFKKHQNQPTEFSGNIFSVLLVSLLIISLFFNLFFYRKLKQINTVKKIDLNKVLTKQEKKVYDLICEEKTNKEIAEALFVSLSTVKTHINNIYKKLEVKDRKSLQSLK